MARLGKRAIRKVAAHQPVIRKQLTPLPPKEQWHLGALYHDIEESTRGSMRGIKFYSQYDRKKFRHWLASLQQRTAHLRSPTIPLNPVNPISEVDIIANATYPWKIEQYPGRYKMLEWLLGVNHLTVRGYHKQNRVSWKACLRVADWLESKAAELGALAREFREKGEAREREWQAKKERNFAKCQAKKREYLDGLADRRKLEERR